MQTKPEILAPAGDESCFLAALAAGADAIYVGLKQFSARMEAENFSLNNLQRLTSLAHAEKRKVYVTLNTLIKPQELNHAWRLVYRLKEQVEADGLIVQDLAFLDLAKQAQFSGMVALSTLANVTTPKALQAAAKLGANRVIVPRELNFTELKILGECCPPNFGIECFVHGALCYCVSGRCYWSSYLGGKSGLRGRCVQPCRRQYSRLAKSKNGERLFSCQDLNLAASVKKLLEVPNLLSWKIEGRKKGPHYVFHTVTAYRLLRDDFEKSREMAFELLGLALGRPSVKARFGNQLPMSPNRQTSSGYFIGKVEIQEGRPVIKARTELLPKDYLRVGVEDEPWHTTVSVKKRVPKGAAYTLPVARPEGLKNGVSVFLIDRREPGLEELLGKWRKRLADLPLKTLPDITMPKLHLPKRYKTQLITEKSAGIHGIMEVGRPGNKSAKFKEKQPGCCPAVWLTPRFNSCQTRKTFFWLPPDLWPENEIAFEDAISALWKKGARRFVCNTPWQRVLFPEVLPRDAILIAGPFCNIANVCALGELAGAGFAAAFISPELAREDILALPKNSPLPLGLVLKGYWPAGISRFGLAGITAGECFKSPRGEVFWSRDYGGSIWIYPAWPLDLSAKRAELIEAGYSFFAVMNEKAPEVCAKNTRASNFNWAGALL